MSRESAEGSRRNLLPFKFGPAQRGSAGRLGPGAGQAKQYGAKRRHRGYGGRENLLVHPEKEHGGDSIHRHG